MNADVTPRKRSKRSLVGWMLIRLLFCLALVGVHVLAFLGAFYLRFGQPTREVIVVTHEVETTYVTHEIETLRVEIKQDPYQIIRRVLTEQPTFDYDRAAKTAVAFITPVPGATSVPGATANPMQVAGLVLTLLPSPTAILNPTRTQMPTVTPTLSLTRTSSPLPTSAIIPTQTPINLEQIIESAAQQAALLVTTTPGATGQRGQQGEPGRDAVLPTIASTATTTVTQTPTQTLTSPPTTYSSHPLAGAQFVILSPTPSCMKTCSISII